MVKPADWDGFARAVADAQHAEQLAAVKRDDPRIPVPQDAVWAEIKRSRDMLLTENELLWAVVNIAREYAKSGTDARLSAALAALDGSNGA